ncbi:hypothetical protein RUM44_012590 [Polyplax serrata]|uniref:Uncharacterized protein n=1 Tax=Polyplax serrata TaxID=468196 RepID=A0ABR1BFM0_POLSC
MRNLKVRLSSIVEFTKLFLFLTDRRSDDGTRPFLRKATRDHRELKQAKGKQRHREVGGGGGSIEEINRRGSPDVKT